MASCNEIWLIDFGDSYPDEPGGVRPALIVGPPDPFIVPFTIVAPTTTVRRGLHVHVEIDVDEESGLDETSYVQCEMIRSISRRRLFRRIGAVGPETGRRVSTVLRTLLDH
ncbi:MAG: type II toxin-antitoxin system PemK/MazF family toxin [Actinomycetota bacterium]